MRDRALRRGILDPTRRRSEGPGVDRYIAEFLGTFFLVVIIGSAVLGGAGPLAPLAVGVGLTAIVYAGGHVSKAHYNPAVTLAFVLQRRLDRQDVVPYLGAQLVGALLGAGAVRVMHDTAAVASLDIIANDGVVAALLAEFLFTFALVWVILSVAIAQRTEGNGFYGVAIGFVVMSGAFSVGTVSGAAFNPAVAIALVAMDLGAWGNVAIQIVAAVVGSVSASYVFSAIERADVAA